MLSYSVCTVNNRQFSEITILFLTSYLNFELYESRLRQDTYQNFVIACTLKSEFVIWKLAKFSFQKFLENSPCSNLQTKKCKPAYGQIKKLYKTKYTEYTGVTLAFEITSMLEPVKRLEKCILII